ncbi:hypothetical protein SS1G_12508 [Sclerotinia sclerotiorum 1980 UF-70]|uniref:Glucose-methanol-choline oxidoreductase N-terminal domain-containing protein n=2 Tax=Sclerotinia sclerotiorum (strain ATCC 18683 / 1980 / Ss-1) TaxID=665079 RepID=A0A1D9Q6R4_SCLS1|nr:hypothetical protein SS1G_12508 [Sclerotinia sclerotiorum 1980 UF-70]APA10650.1 hypothetical protein sscle_06g054200 [Sclerotinia sclerotiorum 1980 UF-70]EDN97654.1 hypothetical protein SS1G_12508 [Sclerotinia sclerotiorum 1980 UF-70]
MNYGSPYRSDYIIVGGGLTGCALASRLAERLGPSSSILILEAGVDPTSNPNSTSLGGGFALPGSELDWAYKTAPNPALGNRVITLVAGKTLGGGSVLNYSGWARGDKRDYDAGARIVDDDRWSYNGMLPYFQRSESVHDAAANPDQYGSHGPMKVTSISASDPKRKYPLREPILKAWAEIGVEHIPTNTGKLDGLSEFLEIFDDSVRQPSHLAFDLSGVRIITETIVHRILSEQTPDQKPRATTVVLADGRKIKVRKEIIISAGAVGSPRLPQLSGVGPASVLDRYSIPVIFDLPAVGQNLFEHFAFFQIFKLRNPERGLSLGHPSLSDPAFFNGMLTLPTSRGSLELASASPNVPPVIAGNYFSTATDHAVLVYGARRLLQCLTSTEIGKEFVETEVGPAPGLEPLTVESSDKDIEDRIRIVGNPHFHIAGTCAIEKVLDTNLRVKGVQG